MFLQGTGRQLTTAAPGKNRKTDAKSDGKNRLYTTMRIMSVGASKTKSTQIYNKRSMREV